jgi:DNA-binding XRE family transcriptional regulator
MHRSLFFKELESMNALGTSESLGVDNALSRALYQLDSSDTELAESSGISRSRINRIKNGHVEPTLYDALVLSKALKMRVGDVFALSTSGVRRLRF